MDRNITLLIAFLGCNAFVDAQTRPADPLTLARAALIAEGIKADDLSQLRIADSYVDARHRYPPHLDAATVAGHRYLQQ